MSTLRSRIAVGFASVIAVLHSLPASAQAYPTRPIELISHTSAGSGTDVVARALADVVRRENLLPAEARGFYNDIGLGAKP